MSFVKESDRDGFLKTSDRPPSKVVYFSIKGRTFATIFLLLPSLGFFACVFCALLFHFEESTATHCMVPNYLPSTSSAIGGYTPGKYIWRICIALDTAPRFMVAFAYYNFHTSFYTKNYILYKRLAAWASFLHIVENGALVGLTYISSTENYGIHKMSFVMFVLSSQLYMVVTCILFKWRRDGRAVSLKDTKSYKWKKICCAINISSLLLASYFFYRHNRYCEPGVYTIFALLEYIIIVTNVMFHATLVLDMDYSVIEMWQFKNIK